MLKYYISTSGSHTLQRLSADTREEAINKAIEEAPYIAEWGEDIRVVEDDGAGHYKEIARLPWNLDKHEAARACFSSEYTSPEAWTRYN